MSTPISKVIHRKDGGEDEGDIEQLVDDDSDLSNDEDMYGPDEHVDTYSSPVARGGLEDEDRSEIRPSNARRNASQGRRLPGSKHTTGSRRARGRDAVASGGESGYFGSPVWRAMISRPFCQALVLAFAIICAVTLSPAASMITSKVPSLESVPYIHAILSSLISAILVTATRPPMLLR